MNLLVTTPLSESQTSAEEAETCKINGGGYYFRRFNSKPKGLDIGSKIYYVDQGYITGYAIVSHIVSGDFLCEQTGRTWPSGIFAVMDSKSWHWIKPVKYKGFQGYRYIDDENFVVIGNWMDKKPKVE